MYHPIIAEALRREHEIREAELKERFRNGTAPRSHPFRTFVRRLIAGAADVTQAAADSARVPAVDVAGS